MANSPSDPRHIVRAVTRVAAGSREQVDDAVAVERALEIHVDGRPLAVTLRTPGDDRDLAVGFLASEGVIRRAGDIREVRETPADCSDEPDRIDVALAGGVTLDWNRLERHFAATAACGLCGRAHLDSLRSGLTAIAGGPPIAASSLVALPERLRAAQVTFVATGGLHAAAWCDEQLEPRVLREDIGRHNAVDKVCGWLMAQGRHPANAGLLWVSGRAGAELVLKAARARIPVMAAVGAPSSLAIELAETSRMTLIGFLRDGRMNLYSGRERVQTGA